MYPEAVFLVTEFHATHTITLSTVSSTTVTVNYRDVANVARGIPCSSPCFVTVRKNTAVTLFTSGGAKPGDFTFTGWSGACSGMGKKCSLLTGNLTDEISAELDGALAKAGVQIPRFRFLGRKCSDRIYPRFVECTLTYFEMQRKDCKRSFLLDSRDLKLEGGQLHYRFF